MRAGSDFDDDDSKDVIKKIFEKCKNKKELRHVRGREVRGSFNCQTGNSVVPASQKIEVWFDYFVNIWF